METNESKKAANAADTTFGHISFSLLIAFPPPPGNDRINTSQIWREISGASNPGPIDLVRHPNDAASHRLGLLADFAQRCAPAESGLKHFLRIYLIHFMGRLHDRLSLTSSCSARL
jgi:hypothetical protein